MARVERRRLAYTDDRFSALPDEILGLVLSSLSMKEAMATSILCSRLRYSWMFTSSLDLHIDYFAALQKQQPSKFEVVCTSPSRTYTLQCMYVRWVDRLLTQLQLLPKSSSNLVSFRLSFHLSSSFTLWIHDWLNYAVTRKVETLDLNLIDYLPEKRYTFPYKQGNFPDNLKLLKKLCLHSVNVSGEAVAFMLGNCRLLDQLSLSQIDNLSSLQVVGTSSVFKCPRIGGCLHQLHTLKMYTSFKIDYTFTMKKKMPNLKELVVVIGRNYCNKWSILPWFEVAPCVQRFVVEASHQEIGEECYTCDDLHDGNDIWDKDEIIRLWNRHEKFRKFYSHVKEVEFVGYRGVFNHFELIAKFVKHGVALHRITVDPRPFQLSTNMPWDHISRNHTEDEIVARNRARDQLKYSRINVNIL
ncbi:hypothetical protein SASPL_148343 [Salvia splendens]|uniref:F-box domain-containing protein n=1 Tax=Salvia splendens TaxID=180675 RepID=A0A8X8W9N8_SALSN|nr:hypothetical protein SASPL_148343 [Salvia splendens]